MSRAAVLTPRPVTTASWLLAVVATGLVLNSVLVFTELDALDTIYGQFGFGRASLTLITAVSLTFAAALLVLARLNTSGSSPARAATWLIGGITAQVTVLSVLAETYLSTASPVSDTLDHGLRSLPAWYWPVKLTVLIASLVVVAWALVLLAAPTADRFFRRPE